MVILSIDGIDCSYGSVDVLKDIHFDVNNGEFLGILGPNGSGKTTLLRSISRVLKPKKGTILIGEKDIYKMKTLSTQNSAIYRIIYFVHNLKLALGYILKSIPNQDPNIIKAQMPPIIAV